LTDSPLRIAVAPFLTTKHTKNTKVQQEPQRCGQPQSLGVLGGSTAASLPSKKAHLGPRLRGDERV